MPLIWIIFLVTMGASWLIGAQLKSKFAAFSKIPTSRGQSGKEVAEQMLRENGLYDVKVVSVQGHLSDHYNPATKTVNLSPDVFNGQHVAAAAVAAHECGHAVQHAKAYAYLQMRSALVPVVGFASKWVQWVLLAGILLIETMPSILLIGIGLFALTTLFSFVTLPVEINASQRALVWLNSAGITTQQSHPKAKEALRWAAYTYVIAALSSLATLLYYVAIFMGRRD